MTRFSKSVGSLETWEPEDRSFSKHVISEGTGDQTPNDGAVCSVNISLVDDVDIKDEDLGSYKLKETVEVTIGEGDTYLSELLDKVECRVCNDVFNLQGERVPRLLMCGHTVCHQCLTRLPQISHSPSPTFVLGDQESELSGSPVLLCPFDRQPTHLGDSGVWGLKKNFALIELLEQLQYSGGGERGRALRPMWDTELLEQEKQLSISCDESDDHVAVLYCLTCATHLCTDCAASTHATRTLARHERVPISQKPHEPPRCLFHPLQLVEFACLEEGCKAAPLMCYICKDYGRHVSHKHELLDREAEKVRSSVQDALQHVRKFYEEITEHARKLGAVIGHVESTPVSYLVQTADGTTTTLQFQGTAEQARFRVKNYFHELREALNRQEITALTTVDTHIRERLCMLRQQQEDMAVLLSQISAISHQCEKTLQQEDYRVLQSKPELFHRLQTVQTQQQHFGDLPEQLQLDPAVPITFTKDNRVHIGPKMEMRVVTLGLEDVGKTSILFQLKQREFVQTIPTIGFNVETVEYKHLKFTIWDVGGQPKLRPLWKHYYLNTQALIFVVDSHNRAILPEVHSELTKLLQEKDLKEASLLIFANKQDLESSASIEELTDQLGLFKLCCSRSWHIQACDAKSGAGLFDGLEWLSHQLVAAQQA